jgi:hypothetical protein
MFVLAAGLGLTPGCSARATVTARSTTGGLVLVLVGLVAMTRAAGSLVPWSSSTECASREERAEMEWAALITWIVTAAGGFLLLTIWLRNGGMKPSDQNPRIRPPLVLGHFALAATGLVAAEPPEQRFPVPAVALDGLLAATTLVLVLLAAAGVG